MKAWLIITLWLLAPVVAAVEVPATGRIEVLFTPWDDAEGALLRVIDAAQRSLHVQMFLLSSRSIARSLIAAHGRGVNVEVLADYEMAMKGENSQVAKLAAAGIAVYLETRYAAAHNKILLIDVDSDHPVVITGSYNLTWSAQARNAENLLILRDNPALARVYFANWRRHRADALPFEAKVFP
ncbi:phospholipase D family protein [Sulfuricystis multivorans]|uniref:phospholipase D family nuclease n=1 Tax=Sulfuricystis multivorans TaxID=2211108 RepID=UPI000F821E4F|nr:phospholipase D family protein [Sulfuricystis multivorans]